MTSISFIKLQGHLLCTHGNTVLLSAITLTTQCSTGCCYLYNFTLVKVRLLKHALMNSSNHEIYTCPSQNISQFRTVTGDYLA